MAVGSRQIGCTLDRPHRSRAWSRYCTLQAVNAWLTSRYDLLPMSRVAHILLPMTDGVASTFRLLLRAFVGIKSLQHIVC